MKQIARSAHLPSSAILALLVGLCFFSAHVWAENRNNNNNDDFDWEEVLPRPPDEIPEGQDDAIEVTPARSVMYESMLQVQDGFYEEAIPNLEWVIATDPTLLGAWQTLGWAYWLTDRRDKAEELWERLVVIAPNEPMGHNLLATVAVRDGDFDRAKELYETSLRLNADQYETRLNYARVLLWMGLYSDAVDELRRLFREDPDRIDVEVELAWAMYANEEYEDAIEHWNNINDMIPDNPPFMMARVDVLMLIGALEEAEAEALRVLEIDPNNLSALNSLATLALRTRRPEEAIEALRRVMEHTDDDRARANVALRIAAFKRAIIDDGSTAYTLADVLSAVRESLDYNDRAVQTHLFYGEALSMDGRFAAAARVFEYVLEEFNPYSIRALYGLVETYFGRAMYDEVERQLTENLRFFNPNNPFRHVYWARLHFARGEYLSALESLERMEYEGSQGAVFSLLYHGISPSEFSDMPSVRQLREHLITLRRNGFRFISGSQLDDYFEQKQGAELVDQRPWLNRVLQSARYSWSGERPELTPRLQDYVPDRVVMVSFDDGLRNSFRYGSQVGEELGIPLSMFVGVGDVLDREQRYVASFREIKAFQESGIWEIHSRLWDAGRMFPVTENEAEEDEESTSHFALPLPNVVWLEDRERLESLREYHARLRREFRDSKRVLARELDLDPAEISAVAYPYGDVGQESESNIRVFHVPDTILNEAEISYEMGFIQHRFGYTMKTDDPMLRKRWEPDRQATGRDVLRTAYRSHPVFMARHMRVEMAALQGELYKALDNIELLRRDGYPEEEIAELRDYVNRHLSRLTPLPEGAEDIRAGDAAERVVDFRNPYIGIDGMINRANEVIDDREVSIFAGMNINPFMGLQVRAGAGRIKQTIETNFFVEVPETTVTTTQSTEQRIEDGEVSNVQVTRTTISTRTVQSNVVERTRYDADKFFVSGRLSYTHDSGSFSIADVRYTEFDGDEIGQRGAFTFGLEHQWRPIPPIDLAVRYQHGLVPSAREIIRFDGITFRPIWRIRDEWHLSGMAHFAYYADKNSYVKALLDNYWRISQRHDIWVGLHHALDTVDRESYLYWSPFWEQRHYVSMRIRRTYPDFSAMLRVYYGFLKSDVRREERDRFANARARGEAQGWSPGSGPDRGWTKLVGFSASVSRSFKNGFDVSADINVSSSDEYTEHTVNGRLMYKF